MKVFTRQTEIKIYEWLGIKVFRGLVFKLEKFIHRKDKGKNINYHVSAWEPRSVDRFVKYLFYNGAIHVRNMILFSVFFLIRYGIFRFVTLADVILWMLFLKDCYCVMLQRYNFLRIQVRIERLQEKQQLKIEKKATKLLGTNPYADEAQLKEDMEFVRELKTKLKDRESIVIGEDDICKLKRLASLLNIT